MKQMMLCALLILTPIHCHGMQKKDEQRASNNDQHQEKSEKERRDGCLGWILRILAERPHNHRGYNNCNV